ncbi:hypothetical protein [Hymenobacter lapidiphilus]|uniref:Uncharacterized protein n=1 Tax=Hymenobacter lapidiphilus TaxID=2608003 RepID=A0A7Y7PST4_9BACT|nr:hypothetical protein [Hymenobacter lapidiphilus]NVO33217.1 hypothetical protein [Hymenobacter lapidiphilus]
MAQPTHRIQLPGAPAEDVDQTTIDILAERRLIGAYTVTKLKTPDKPADLTKAPARVADASKADANKQ